MLKSKNVVCSQGREVWKEYDFFFSNKMQTKQNQPSKQKTEGK